MRVVVVVRLFCARFFLALWSVSRTMGVAKNKMLRAYYVQTVMETWNIFRKIWHIL